MRSAWSRALPVRIAILAVAALAFGLTACGGGGHALPPASQAQSVTNAGGGSTVKSAAKSRVTLKIKVPARTTTSATKRAPQYVSAASESLAIYVSPVIAPTPSAPTVVVDLNPNDSGSACTLNTDGTRACSIAIAAPDGNDVFTISAYDLSPSSGSIPANANLLSTGTIDQTITANAVNTLDLTLEGVVAGLQFSRPSVFLQSNPGANQLTVNATDADGNIIVSDSYANPITVTANNVPTVGDCGSSQYPNAFTFGTADGSTNTGSTTTTLNSVSDASFALYYNGLPCYTWATALTSNSTLTATTTSPVSGTTISATPISVYPDFYIFTSASSSGTLVKVDPGQNLVTDSVTLPPGTLVGLAAMPVYASIAYAVNNIGTGTVGSYSYDGTMVSHAGTPYSLSNLGAIWFNSSAAGVPSLYAIGGSTYDPIARLTLSSVTPPDTPVIGGPAPNPIFSAPITVEAVGGTNLSLAGGYLGATDCITFVDTTNGRFYAVQDNGSTLPTTYQSSSAFFLSGAAPTAFAAGALGQSFFEGDSDGTHLITLNQCGSEANQYLNVNPAGTAPVAAVMSPDESAVFVAYGGSPASVALFPTIPAANFATETPTSVSLPSGFTPTSIAIDPGGTTLIVGGTNAEIVLLSAIDGSYLQTLYVDTPTNGQLNQITVADNVLTVASSVSKARRPMSAVPRHHYVWARR